MKYEIKPIAFVKNNRINVKDEYIKAVTSEIVLVDGIKSEALDGIEKFSHLEIIYYFHKVPDKKAIAKLGHPQGREDIPMTGTFARRTPNRPNRIGLTTVELIERKERSLIVKYLDAINDTPVIDIKPVVRGFEPKGKIRQPNWIKDASIKHWGK